MSAQKENGDASLSFSILNACVLFFAIMLLGGCANSRQAIKAPLEQETEQWDKLAETSKGHSPSPIQKTINISDYRRQIEQELSTSGEKPLPNPKINLKMRNADIKSILRAMARSMNVNILVRDEVKGNTSVDFVAVPWDQAFRSLLKAYSLTYVWEGDILRVVSLQDIEEAFKVETLKAKQGAEELAAQASEPLSSVVIPIDYADPKALRENLQDFLTKVPTAGAGSPGVAGVTGAARGSVRVDEHSNSLIIQATHPDIEKMIAVIEKVDKPTPQILIRANIVETTKNVARDLGIQWGGIMHTNKLFVTPGGGTTMSTSGTGTAGSTSSNTTGIPDPVTSGAVGVGAGYTPSSGVAGLSGQGLGISFPVSSNVIQAAGGIGALGLMWGKLSGNILETQLQALQTDGKANIIASPSITTLDNQKAFTESGTKVPYVTTQSSGGTTTATVNFVDAVLRLEITPHVIGDKNLKMTIVVKKDDVDISKTVQGNPFITKKQTETVLIVEDGETIVISGLTSQNKSKTVNGVPDLKDIPILGWLFKGESKSDSTDEILIFITPHILPKLAAAGKE